MNIFYASKLEEIKASIKDKDRAGNTFFDSVHYGLLMIHLKSGCQIISELHENADDVYFILEGKADIVIGGEILGGKADGKGNIFGNDVKGGESFFASAGEIVHIPRGKVHLVKPRGEVYYYVVKVK